MQHLEAFYTRKTLRNQDKLRRNYAGARLRKQGMLFVSLLFVVACLQNERLSGRILSVNLGGAGKCPQLIGNISSSTTTGVQSLNNDDEAATKLKSTTFLASYPGSGKRLTWKIMEALTGNTMREDDWDLSENHWDSIRTMKASWPHPEGIWSFDGDHMDQVFLLVRNPRFAIPSYHKIKYELSNADKESKSNDGEGSQWESWRDAHLNEELNRWSEYIEYWMQDGPKSNSTDGEGPEEDWHCFREDCTPKAVIQFEKLMSPNPITGQNEMNKIGSILATSPNLHSVDQEVRPCVYNQVMSRRQLQKDNDGPTSNNLKSFTTDQLGLMKAKIETLKEKYSAHPWSQRPVAIDLTNALDYYVGEIEAEYQLSKQQDAMEED